MGERAAIVVARAPRIAGYRDGAHRDALVLEQIGLAPTGRLYAALAAITSSAVVVSGISTGSAVADACFALLAAALGGGLGHLVDRVLRKRARPAVRVVVAERALRVFRPGDAPQPQTLLSIDDLAAIRVEDLPMDDVDAWSLVAVREEGERIRLLDTHDRHAASRVLTLILDRLVADGAFTGVPMVEASCPVCRARVLAPARWVPVAVACGTCGVEARFERAA